MAAEVNLSPAAERQRRQLLSPWLLRAYLLRRIPLAAFAGLRVRRLDEAACEVWLPGGWRTRNPFASTYFAAQAMAAELSVGAPAAVLVASAPASVAFILRGIKAVFTKKIVGGSLFTFEDLAGLKAAVDRAAAAPEEQAYTGRSTGRTAEGEAAAEFEVTWSFKRRDRAKGA
jgi:Domain of unknown function (DUF4442)